MFQDLLKGFANPWTSLSKISTFSLVAIGVLIVLIVLFFFLRKLKLNTRTLVMASASITIAFVLSFIKFYAMPQGGSITPGSMLPILLFAWYFGPVPGIAAGIVYGCLQLLQDFYVVHPLQLFLDYIFAFGALGIAGFLKKSLNIGIISAGLSRLIFHVISGAVFFAEYAPAGQSPWIYSLVYNASVVLPDLIICLIVANIPVFRNALAKVYRKEAKV